MNSYLFRSGIVTVYLKTLNTNFASNKFVDLVYIRADRVLSLIYWPASQRSNAERTIRATVLLTNGRHRLLWEGNDTLLGIIFPHFLFLYIYIFYDNSQRSGFGPTPFSLTKVAHACLLSIYMYSELGRPKMLPIIVQTSLLSWYAHQCVRVSFAP